MKVPEIFFVMGVSASGKSTIGKALARTYDKSWHDGDDYHSASNIEKMSAGIPLTDADRASWLRRLNEVAREAIGHGGAVLACSALKESYREELIRGMESAQVAWIVLHSSFEALQDRISGRDHFMPPSLLRSQFKILELPGYGIHLDATKLTVPEMLVEIKLQLEAGLP